MTEITPILDRMKERIHFLLPGPRRLLFLSFGLFIVLAISACGTKYSDDTGAENSTNSQLQSGTYTIKVWIDSNGRVERYESDATDLKFKKLLQEKILKMKVAPPPAGMPMPVTVRLRLQPK